MREHTWYIHEGVPRWAGGNRRGVSPALPRNGDVLFERGEGHAIFVVRCPAQNIVGPTQGPLTLANSHRCRRQDF